MPKNTFLLSYANPRIGPTVVGIISVNFCCCRCFAYVVEIIVANNIETACSDLWRRMFVWWDGKINPCDVDYKSELLIGLFKNNNISNLWKSKQYIELRNGHKSKLRKKISPCNRCSVI